MHGRHGEYSKVLQRGQGGSKALGGTRTDKLDTHGMQDVGQDTLYLEGGGGGWAWPYCITREN